MSPARSRAGAPLALLVLALSAGPARAQEASPRDGLRAAARALALVAAARGEAQALALAGPDAPTALRDALSEVARSPRAADLRELGDRADLQAALLEDLLAEAPKARAALTAFADEAAGRLERELRLVEDDAARLDRASKALLAAATAGELASRRAAAAREQGEALLELGARDPVVRRVLAEAETSSADRRVAARYRALTAHFDREADGAVAAALVVLSRTIAGAPEALDATGGAAARALADRVGARIQAALAGLLLVAERATDASRRLRDEELRRVGEQARGPELEQAVRMAAAYRRQWKVPPSLRATRFADVYEDRATARIVVWLEGEDRWAEGPTRVDPVEPVVSALLAARDPALRARAADPRAIARLYALWEGEGEPSRPFAGGMAEVVAAARAAGAALRALRDVAAAAGVSQAAADDAVLVRAGLPVDVLLGPAAGGAAGGDLAADAAVERRVSDEVARVAVERGPEAGRALAAALREAAAALGALAPRAVVVTLEDAAAPGAPLLRAVDLAWTPDPEAEPAAWLVPPPTRVAAGGRRAGGIALSTRLPSGQPASDAVQVRAFAWDGARVVAASGRADVAGAALRLAPAPGPGLVLRTAPGGQPSRRVVVLPLEGPRLVLELAEPGSDAGRPLAPAPGGAWVALRPVDAPGKRVVLGRDVTRGGAGEVVARLEVELPLVAGVVLSSEGSDKAAGEPRLVVTQGAKVELRVVEGGQSVAARRPFRIVDEGGALVLDRTAETLRWTADVPPGRYVALVEGARAWPFAVTDRAARIAAAAHPAGPGLEAHPAGAGLVLRVDAWPSVLAEEVRRVRWRIEGGPAPVEVVTRPGPLAAWHTLELPVRLDPKAVTGSRKVSALVETDQGTVEATGGFAVTAATKPIEVELRAADGERLRAVPLGGPADALLLRAGEGLERPSWVVVSPAGRARGLAPRFDGQAALAFDQADPPGPWEVWVRATRAGGEKAAGRLVVMTYAPVALQVAVSGKPVLGDKVLLEATPPLGFRGPFRVRKDGGSWLEGAAVEVVAQASNEVGVTLEDQDGRRARAVARFAGERAGAVEPVSQVRYGIVANCAERRLFAAEHALLQAYKKNDNLPPGWVVLELGPMPAAKVRDRMFQTLPYDGPPSGTDAQAAYRSKRFWSALQASARAGFKALGVAEGEPFEVLNSPSPGGEETLRDLAARLVAEQGGWAYRLVRVRVVRAEGAVADKEPPRDAPPASPASELRLFKVANSGEGRNVTRVEVPSPLGELHVAPIFPEGLTLGRTERLGVSVLARRGPLVAGRRYPGGWEALLPDALLCAEVEVEVDVEGRSRARGTARHLGRAVAGADVGVTLSHLGPEPSPTAGRPRRAERYGLLVDPFTVERPAPVEVRFDPIWPGLLDNVPRQLVVTVRARLVPAVATGRWPAGKAGPEPVVVEGARVVLGGPDLPEATVEVQATYLRQAPECPKPWPATLPALGAVRAGEQAPSPAIDGPAALAMALAALAIPDLDAAEAAARQAVFARPGEAEPWAVLADVLLARERPVLALVTARWAQALGASTRASLVAGEALLADGDVDGARAAAAEAAKARPTGALAARLEALSAKTRE